MENLSVNYIFGILIILLLAGARWTEKGERWQNDALSLQNAKCIQGLCALGVILHHLTQKLHWSGTDMKAVTIFLETGTHFVGIFFFFSGFGLMKSLLTKPDYLKGFLYKRLMTVLIPFYVCNFAYIALSNHLGFWFDQSRAWEYYTGWYLFNGNAWYMVVIVFFYIAFYFAYRFIKNRPIATGLIFMLSIGLVALGITRDHDGYWMGGEWWYNTLLLFPVGLTAAQLEPALIRLGKKRISTALYWIALPLALVGDSFFYNKTMEFYGKYGYYSGNKMDALPTVIVQTASVFCFVMFVVLLMQKLRFRNVFLRFFGMISLELYLMHKIFVEYLRSDMYYIHSTNEYIAWVYILAIALATVIHFIDAGIIRLAVPRRKKLKNKEETV